MLSRLMTRREQALLLGIAVAIFLGSAALYWHNNSATGPETPDTALPLPREPVNEPQRQTDSAPPMSRKTRDDLQRQPASKPLAAPVVTPPVAATVVPAAPVANSEIKEEEVAVAVTGAIRKPGLYRVNADARVADLLESAGGALDDADLNDINLGAHLIDGTTLTVPLRPSVSREGNSMSLRRISGGEEYNPPQYRRSAWHNEPQPVETSAPIAAAPVVKTTVPAAPSEKGLLNLNTATAEEIEELPGIGPVLAERIASYRDQTPFASVEDLRNVSGIGPKRLEALRPLVTVE
jgi:competence protein ComEA